MPEPEYPGLTPQQEKELKLAVESTCEICSGYFAPEFLDIHLISRRRYREMVRDPSTRILVVCRDCHEKIHRLPVRVKDQRTLVASRQFFVRQDIRRVLGYRPKPYKPPEIPESYEVTADYYFNFPPGSFRIDR